MKPEIVALVDLENILKALGERSIRPERFSLETGFDKLVDWLSQFGEIAWFCVFVPTHLIYRGIISQKDLEYFQRKNFFTVVCPKMGTDQIDTADLNLLRWGLNMVLPHLSGITHLCIGSGDIDFLKLHIEAQKKDLKLMASVGTPKALSGAVEKLVDIDLETGEKMIHYFNPQG